METELINDVSSASAAYLFNQLPEIMKLPPAEQFKRLALHIEAALIALTHAKAGWVPSPSKN